LLNRFNFFFGDKAAGVARDRCISPLCAST